MLKYRLNVWFFLVFFTGIVACDREDFSNRGITNQTSNDSALGLDNGDGSPSDEPSPLESLFPQPPEASPGTEGCSDEEQDACSAEGPQAYTDCMVNATVAGATVGCNLESKNAENACLGNCGGLPALSDEPDSSDPSYGYDY